MKLVIAVGSMAIVCDTPGAGMVISALEGAKVYDKPWYADKEYKPREETLEFSFIEDSRLTPTAEPIQKLADQAAENSKRWLDEYHNHAKTKEELAAAKARIAEFEKLAAPKVD